MIIVSQIKKMIMNFDNVCELGLNKNNPKEILSTTNNNNTQILGIYKTEERAKEVLKEIIKKYEMSMRSLGKQTISFEDIYVYEMPKE